MIGTRTLCTNLQPRASCMTNKSVQVEEIKRAKDGLDVWEDIHRYAALGDYSAIEPDDFERFKWYGIYRQKPKDGYFMCRIKIPGGALTAPRLREIGTICNLYGRGIGDVTTRQDIQLHWVRIQDVPDLFDRIYNKLGMYQEFSCGDAPRNTTACPLAGEIADEIVDCGPFAQAIADMYRQGGKEFSNRPASSSRPSAPAGSIATPRRSTTWLCSASNASGRTARRNAASDCASGAACAIRRFPPSRCGCSCRPISN